MQCNPPGTRKESDKSSLEDKREQASLYVGESARSVNERAAEHWRDAEKGKEESHMQEHQAGAHGGEQPPNFAFRVVKKCKSSLERQVREAVRIQMRRNVLNKQGIYNRCKLTKLVVDEEWEQRVWKESWEPRVVKVDEEGIRAEGSKSRKRGDENDNKKRRKMDSDGAEAWGETAPATQESRDKFLYNTPNLDQRAGAKRQTVIKPITGIEWMSRQIIEEVVKRAGELAEWSNEMASWEEWEEEKEHQPRRSEERKNGCGKG